MSKKGLSRREFIRLSTLTAAGAALAACAPQEPEPQPTPEPEEVVVKETVIVEGTPEVVEKVVTATPPPVEEAEIVFWNYWGGIEPIFLAMSEMFMERNDAITVKYELLPWDQYKQKLNATLVTGNPPDVWYTAPTFYFEYVDRGQLVDISPYLEVDGDISEDDWFPRAIDQWRAGDQDHLFGLPSDFVAQVAYYNKDLFDEAGLDYPEEGWSWDDLLTMAQAMTKRDASGRTEVWGCMALRNGWHLDQVIESMGGEVINEEQTECLLTASPIPAEVLQFMVDLIYEHEVAPPSGEFEGMGSPFLTGQVGIDFGLTIGQIQYKDAPFAWSNQLIPEGTAEQVNYGGANGFVVSSPTQYPDQSYEFVKFLTSQAGPILYIGTGLVPVRQDLATNPAFLQQPPPPDDYDVWAKAVEYSDHNYGRGFDEWQSAKNNELEAAYLGNVTPEEAVENACEAMNAALARIQQEKAAGE
jgi:multiple sugar transport system substrate-binding protein